jgi:hypothetical protein
MSASIRIASAHCCGRLRLSAGRQYRTTTDRWLRRFVGTVCDSNLAPPGPDRLRIARPASRRDRRSVFWQRYPVTRHGIQWFDKHDHLAMLTRSAGTAARAKPFKLLHHREILRALKVLVWFLLSKVELSSLQGLPCQPHIRRDDVHTTVPYSGRESSRRAAPLCKNGTLAPGRTTATPPWIRAPGLPCSSGSTPKVDQDAGFITAPSGITP